MSPTQKIVSDVLSGDTGAAKLLVKDLLPVVQSAAAGTLRRYLPKGSLQRAYVEDVVQEVFLVLLDNDCKLLRDWSEDRSPLPAYVRLVTRCRALMFLRQHDNQVWNKAPVEDEALGAESFEHEALRNDIVRKVLAEMEKEIVTPKARRVFTMLFLESLEVDDVCEQTGMKRENVHTLSSRIARRIREAAQPFLGGVAAPRRADD